MVLGSEQQDQGAICTYTYTTLDCVSECAANTQLHHVPNKSGQYTSILVRQDYRKIIVSHLYVCNVTGLVVQSIMLSLLQQYILHVHTRRG